MGDLIEASLRQSVDRIVVGEVRGKEILPMLAAMQAGKGSVSTIHAGNAEDAIRRAEATGATADVIHAARGALRVYGIAVVTMLALLPVTRLVALALDAPTAQIALVAAVVGGHFLPFARAFQAPVFWWIGGAMAVLGLAGAVLAALGDPVAGPAGAAAAGAAMLVIVAAQGLLASPRQD